jgi:hypothetical protein
MASCSVSCSSTQAEWANKEIGDLAALVSKGGADADIGSNIMVSSLQDRCADFVLIHIPGDRPVSEKVGLVSPVANLLKMKSSFNQILLK